MVVDAGPVPESGTAIDPGDWDSQGQGWIGSVGLRLALIGLAGTELD